jgi:hypothetical protein
MVLIMENGQNYTFISAERDPSRFKPVNNITDQVGLLIIALLVRRGAALPGRDEIAREHVPRLGIQLLLRNERAREVRRRGREGGK